MYKRSLFLSGLIVLVMVSGTALAQGPIKPGHSDPEWQASYWNNMTLSGPPALQRGEANLDHDWGSGSPHANVPADRFSARWKRYIDV